MWESLQQTRVRRRYVKAQADKPNKPCTAMNVQQTNYMHVPRDLFAAYYGNVKHYMCCFPGLCKSISGLFTSRCGRSYATYEFSQFVRSSMFFVHVLGITVATGVYEHIFKLMIVMRVDVAVTACVGRCAARRTAPTPTSRRTADVTTPSRASSARPVNTQAPTATTSNVSESDWVTTQ